MKSEHRHELKTNDLQRLTRQIAEKIDPYTNQLLIGLIVVSLVGGGLMWWIRSSGAAAASGWTELAAARNAEDFAEVTEKFQGQPVAAWAGLSEAEDLLQSGIQLSFVNRSGAISDLNAARTSFEKVLETDDLQNEIRVRALFGLARCLETTSDGDVAPAIAAYERMLTQLNVASYAATYREIAEQRIEQLKTASGQEFYAWYYKQNPKPEDRPQPRDGLPPGFSPGQFGAGEIRLQEIPERLRLPDDDASEEEAGESLDETPESDSSENTQSDAPENKQQPASSSGEEAESNEAEESSASK